MRRRLLGIVVLVLVAAACTPDGGDTTTTAPATTSPSTTAPDAGSTTSSTAPTPTAPPVVTIGTDGFSNLSLNPFDPDGTIDRFIGNAVWATVYDIDPVTWDRIPDVVTGLPSQSGAIEVNDDGTMTVRYEVRSGARWSDGLPISGEDIAFTAETMRDLAGSNGQVADVMATVVATDAVEQVAFITFEEPNLAFEDALWIVLPSHALADVDVTSGDGTDWPSGGPFVVTEYEPGNSMALVRNDFYGKTDADGVELPYLDELRVGQAREDGIGGSEPETPTSGFLARDFHVIEVPNWEEDIARVEAQVSDGAAVEAVPTPIIEHLTFQFGGERDAVNESSLNDLSDYRKSVAHAIDREALLAETRVPWFAETPGMLIPTESAWDQYSYDPAVGAALIDDIAPDGAAAVLSTTGNGDYRIRIGDALASSFADIGVDYSPVYLDSVLFFGETLNGGAFDIGMWAWVSDGGYTSQLGLLDLFDPTNAPPEGNFARWGEDGLSESAQRFAEIAASARSTIDPDEFSALVAEAEGILADNALLIPLFSRGQRIAWWADTVTGIIPNGSVSSVTWNLEEWSLTE